MMSEKGNYTEHLEQLIQAASNLSSWVLRTFYTRAPRPMLTLYKSMILSKLDYCSPLWHPHCSATLTNRLEAVQRSFTQRIQGMADLSYWDRLNALNLRSLQRRRERYIIIYVQKILLKLVPNCGLLFRENQRTGLYAEKPRLLTASPTYIKNMRADSFQVVAPTLYNLLPASLRRTSDCVNPLLSFKTQLDKLLAKIPDQPTVSGLCRAAESNSLVHQVQFMTA